MRHVRYLQLYSRWFHNMSIIDSFLAIHLYSCEICNCCRISTRTFTHNFLFNLLSNTFAQVTHVQNMFSWSHLLQKNSSPDNLTNTLQHQRYHLWIFCLGSFHTAIIPHLDSEIGEELQNIVLEEFHTNTIFFIYLPHISITYCTLLHFTFCNFFLIKIIITCFLYNWQPT